MHVSGSNDQIVPRVLKACGELPSLHRLEMHITDEALVWRDGRRIRETPYRWADAGGLKGWDVGGLLSLRTLLVRSHGNLDADEAFGRSVARLLRLKCLDLSYSVDTSRLLTLVEGAQDSGCWALQEVTWGRPQLDSSDFLEWQPRTALVRRAAGGGFELDLTALQ